MRNKKINVIGLIFYAGKKELILIIILSALSGILTSVEVIIWKYLVDGITGALVGGSIRYVVLVMAVYMLSAIISSVISKISTQLNWGYTEKLNNGLNNAVLSKCAKIDFSQFNNSDTYDNISRISNESISSLSNLMQSVTSLIQYIIAYISVVIILKDYNVYIIIIASVAILPVLIINLKLSKKLYEINCEITEPKRLIDKLKRCFYDYKEIQEIKVYKSENFIIDKIRKMQTDNYHKESSFRLHKIRVELFVNAAYVVVNYGMKLVSVITSVRSAFSIGTITMYINSIDQICSDLQNTVYYVSSLNQDKYYVNALIDFLNQEESESGEKYLKEEICDVRFEHVYFRYPGAVNYALYDVSFNLKAGKSYLLWGSNGSGKSTIIKLMLGLYKPEKGKIYINGMDLTGINKDTYYEHIGIMMQEYNKYPFSIKENIILDREFLPDRVNDVLNKTALREYIEKLPAGIDEILDNEQENGTNLSLGQWQRVAICRMLYETHDFVILDEPTAALDLKVANEIIRYCVDNTKTKILLIIAHDKDVQKKVDNILKIENGRMVF